jgi:cell division protein FtsB
MLSICNPTVTLQIQHRHPMHGNGTSRNPVHWKLRKANKKVARECETLKTQIALLNTELKHKQDFVGRLEFLIHQRNEMIDALHGRIDQLREQNKRLDVENEHLCEMVRLSPDPF